MFEEQGMGWCTDCRRWRYASLFLAHAGRLGNMANVCQPCHRALRMAQDPGAPPGWSRERVKSLKSGHGISAWDWEALFFRQGRTCYICQTAPEGVRWVVDHDHGCCPGKRSCGKCVQGIACNGCNWAEAILWAVRQRGGLDAVARLVTRSELAR